MNWNMRLVRSHSSPFYRSSIQLFLPGLVTNDSDDEIQFHTTYSHPLASSSISSLQEFDQGAKLLDPFDFTPYMDQVCARLLTYGPE